MTIKMRFRKAALILVLVVPGLALAACIYAGVNLPATNPVEVGSDDLESADAWRAIAEEFSDYGNLGIDVEGPVNFYIDVPWGPNLPLSMPKMCGETLEQAADGVADGIEAQQPGGGGPGGDDDYDGLADGGDGGMGDCFSDPGQACTTYTDPQTGESVRHCVFTPPSISECV